MAKWTQAAREAVDQIYTSLGSPKLSKIAIFHLLKYFELLSGGKGIDTFDWSAEDDNTLEPNERYMMFVRKIEGIYGQTAETMGRMYDFYEMERLTHDDWYDDTKRKLVKEYQSHMVNYMLQNGGRIAGKSKLKEVAFKGGNRDPEIEMMETTIKEEALESTLSALEFDGRAVYDVDIDAFIPVSMIPLAIARRGWVVKIRIGGAYKVGMVYEVMKEGRKVILLINIEGTPKEELDEFPVNELNMDVWHTCPKEIEEKRISEWEKSGKILQYAEHSFIEKKLSEMNAIESKGSAWYKRVKTKKGGEGWRNVPEETIKDEVRKARNGKVFLRKIIGLRDWKEGRKLLQIGGALVGGELEKNIETFVPKRYADLYLDTMGEKYVDMIDRKQLDIHANNKIKELVELIEKVRSVNDWANLFPRDTLDILDREVGIIGSFSNNPAEFLDEIEDMIEKLNAAYEHYLSQISPQSWGEWQEEIIKRQKEDVEEEGPAYVQRGLEVPGDELQQPETKVQETSIESFIQRLGMFEMEESATGKPSKGKTDLLESLIEWIQRNPGYLDMKIDSVKELLAPYPEYYEAMFVIYIQNKGQEIFRRVDTPSEIIMMLNYLKSLVAKENISQAVRETLLRELEAAMEMAKATIEEPPEEKIKVPVVPLGAALQSREPREEREVIRELGEQGVSIDELRGLLQQLPDILQQQGAGGIPTQENGGVGIARRTCPKCKTVFVGPDNPTIQELIKIVNFPQMMEYLTFCPSCIKSLPDFWNQIPLVERLDWLIGNEKKKGLIANVRKLEELQRLIAQATKEEPIAPREQVTQTITLFLQKMFANNIKDYLKEGAINFFFNREEEIQRVVDGVDMNIVAPLVASDVWDSFTDALRMGRGVNRQIGPDEHFKRYVLDATLSAFTRNLLIEPLFGMEGFSGITKYENLEQYPTLKEFLKRHGLREFDPQAFFDTFVNLVQLRG